MELKSALRPSVGWGSGAEVCVGGGGGGGPGGGGMLSIGPGGRGGATFEVAGAYTGVRGDSTVVGPAECGRTGGNMLPKNFSARFVLLARELVNSSPLLSSSSFSTTSPQSSSVSSSAVL